MDKFYRNITYLPRSVFNYKLEKSSKGKKYRSMASGDWKCSWVGNFVIRMQALRAVAH